MKLLLVINRGPYENGQVVDVAWNALRLAQTSLAKGWEVRLFLMNRGVELAREGLKPEAGQLDLIQMLKELLEKGAQAKLCQTCLHWHHIGKDEVIAGAEVAGMIDLVNWIADSDKVLSF